MHPQITELLTTVAVDGIKKFQTLIALAPTDTVSQAFQTLSQRQITSVAIYDHTKDQFLGFVDAIDLGVFVVQLFLDNYAKHPHLYDPKELDQRFQAPVMDVINASKRDIFHGTENLRFLIKNFLQFGVHRVPVKEMGKIVGIVSQSDVVNYLYARRELYPELLARHISDLFPPSFFQKPLVTIRYDQTFLQAFATIISSGITGLAVTDLHGKLVNNISASDLKGISQQSFFRLEVPIHQILAYRTSKLTPVACTLSWTLGQVMEKIHSSRVHRVWVVNEENHPIGVLTLTDLLQVFAQHCA